MYYADGLGKTLRIVGDEEIWDFDVWHFGGRLLWEFLRPGAITDDEENPKVWKD